MAITRSFGGQTLLKPGGYSISRVDNAQGIAVGENNTLMLIGEATDGIPGETENSRVFTNVQRLIDYYVSGDIVDAALAAGRPSLTPGISGPTNFIVYKTNASLAATYNIVVGTAPTGDGTVVFDITFPINASGETITETIDIDLGIDTIVETANTIRDGLNANLNFASVFIAATPTDGTVTITALKNGPQFGAFDATNNPSGKVVIAFNQGALTPTTVISTASPVPTTNAASPNALALLGATTTAQLILAFTDAFNFDPNVIVPLWSNPDISTGSSPNPGVDPFQSGITHIAVSAPIAAAQLQDHLILRSSVTVRKEAQGMIGIRNSNWRDSYGNGVMPASPLQPGLAGLTTFLAQAMIQDVRIVDSLGTLSWKGPHIMAAVMAGIRLGSSVGEPLTFKVINANGVGHNIDPSTGMPAAAVNQFRPGFDFNEAILNGLTFTELASGGNRIVVDNTRYAIDESFVFNRGSVIEAAQFVARTSRNILEQIFVGQKVSNGAAESLKNVLRNYLISLNQDNIITSSSDAPFGFVEETFTVSINGNTAEIQVEVKPVQGLDFIFIDFTLGNITQSA